MLPDISATAIRCDQGTELEGWEGGRRFLHKQQRVHERGRRAAAIRAHVREHDLAAWIEAQLADLDGVAASTRR